MPGRRRWMRPLLTLGLPALIAALGGLVLTSQVANAGQDAADVTCTLVVPHDPLSAKGLTTPYRLKAPCREADAGSAAFVQATIVDPATGAVSVYNPLVVDDGARAAAAPAAANLPAGAVVGLWFGFNGDNLRLADDRGSLAAGRCVNGADRSIFGQFAYCNAPDFFAAANAAIAAGRLKVPGLGTAADGRPCPTTRDFGLVDMDQSDNVTTTYLVFADGRTAQNTAANRTTLARRGARIAVNGSDNALLDAHVFPALGCTPYRAPDLADAGAPATALALNELQAAAHQPAPVAMVPTSDPMTKVRDRPDVAKTNLYRAGVDQRPIDQATETPTAYCASLLRVGADRLQLDRSLTVRAASPDPAAANSLFTFLAQRFGGAYDDLGCPRLVHTRNPVTVTTDRKGTVVSARLAQPPTQLAANSPPAVQQTTKPPQPVHTTSQPARPPQTGQAPPPVTTTSPAAHPPQTGQAPPPSPSTAAETEPAPTPASPSPDPALVNANDFTVDPMRLDQPSSQGAPSGGSVIPTVIGVVLIAGAGIGFAFEIVRAARRNRIRYLGRL